MGTFDSSGAFMPMKVLRMMFLLLLWYCFNIYLLGLLHFFWSVSCIRRVARRQSWRSLSLRGLRKRKRRETALLIWRGTALKETKTRVRRDRMSLFDLTFTCCLLSFTFTDHSQWRIHYFFPPSFLPLLASQRLKKPSLLLEMVRQSQHLLRLLQQLTVPLHRWSPNPAVLIKWWIMPSWATASLWRPAARLVKVGHVPHTSVLVCQQDKTAILSFFKNLF